jgi:hypothetical protein
MPGICICIGKDCTAKRTLGVEGLAAKVQQAKMVEALAAEWAAKDPTKTAEQIFTTTIVKDRDGNERERQISISEARMEFYDLQHFLSECTSCQANVHSDRFKGGVFSGFGCFIHIDVPISKQLEDALFLGANRAIRNAKVDPCIVFLDRIAKEKLSGASIARLRSSSPPGIESTDPQSVTWGGFLGKKTVNTDQMFEMMFKDAVTPEDALVYHHFLENMYRALKETAPVTAGSNEAVAGSAQFAMQDLAMDLSSLFATAAEMQKVVNVYKDM